MSILSGRVPLLLLLVLLSQLVTSCTPEPPLRIGTNRWPGYEPLYLARSQGLLRDTGIRLVELPSSTDVMQYLRTGALEGGALTLDEALTLCTEGVDLKAILVLDISNGADAVLARPEITKLKDLKGKRIGVENSAVGALMLNALLEAAGLSIDDIEPVPLTVDEHFQAYIQGRVDAVVTFDPIRTKLLERGAHLLFDSSRIPGRIIDILAVRKETLSRNPGSLRQLLLAYFEARQLMKIDPTEAMRKMAPRLDMQPAELAAALEGMVLPDLEENHRWLEGSPPPLDRRAAQLQQLMYDRGLLTSVCSKVELAEGAFLPDEAP